MPKAQAKPKAVPAKTRSISFKVTPEQYALIEARAEHRGMLVGPWLRSIVLQAATAPSNKHFIRIQEPNGATT